MVASRSLRRISLSATAIALALAVVGMAGAAFVLVSAIRPMSYPNSTFDGWRTPAVNFAWADNCLKWISVTKGLYRSNDDPGQVLEWYKGQGWMDNFRLNHSVLQQTAWASGFLKIQTAQEAYAERPRQSTLIMAMKQTIIGLGNCR